VTHFIAKYVQVEETIQYLSAAGHYMENIYQEAMWRYFCHSYFRYLW